MRVVQSLTPGAIAWDSMVRGFAVRCQRARSIFSKPISPAGRAGFGSVTRRAVDTRFARAEAQVLWGKIRAGEDLAAMRKARRQRATVADLCARYLEEHAREHKKASSAHLDKRNIENHIRPLVGELYVDDVSRADIDRLKRAIKDGKTSKPGASNRTSFRGGKVVAGGAVVATAVSRCSPKCSIWPSSGVGGRNIPIRSAISETQRGPPRALFVCRGGCSTG